MEGCYFHSLTNHVQATLLLVCGFPPMPTLSWNSGSVRTGSARGGGRGTQRRAPARHPLPTACGARDAAPSSPPQRWEGPAQRHLVPAEPLTQQPTSCQKHTKTWSVLSKDVQVAHHPHCLGFGVLSRCLVPLSLES